MDEAQVNPNLETQYRRHYLAIDKNRFILGVILWSISFVGFAFSDYLLIGEQGRFWVLFTVRVMYALFGGATLAALSRIKLDLTAFDSVVVVWVIVTVILDLFVGALRPREDFSVVIEDLLGVVSFYVFISNRMSYRVLPALALSLANLGMILFFKRGIPEQVALALAFGFTVTNLVGLIFSRHYFIYRRGEFLARREEARIQAELKRLASTDPLTGVYNRRRLLELAGEALYRFRRYGRPFSILVTDLDGFKKVNDTFGHHQGDAVLVAFARAVMEEKREADSLGRMGGDEFCLVLPETTPAAAEALARRILERCGEIVLADGRGEVRVTASIGISQALPEDISLDPLFARADAALYRAKNEGRNRCVVV